MHTLICLTIFSKHGKAEFTCHMWDTCHERKKRFVGRLCCDLYKSCSLHEVIKIISYQFLSKMGLTIFSPKRSSWVSYAHHLFHCPYVRSHFFFMYVLYSQQGERIHSPFPFLNCLNSVISWILKTSRELFGVTKSQFLKRVTGLDVYESCIIFLWLLFLHLLAKG